MNYWFLLTWYMNVSATPRMNMKWFLKNNHLTMYSYLKPAIVATWEEVRVFSSASKEVPIKKLNYKYYM